MSKTETALKLALEALELEDLACRYEKDPTPEHIAKAITAIKEALSQPEQEPVAFYVYKPTLPRGHLGNVSDGDLPWVYDQDPSSGYSARMLVYTTPPHRKPLSDEELRVIENKINPNMRWRSSDEEGITLYPSEYYELVRAIEAKLKEKNT